MKIVIVGGTQVCYYLTKSMLSKGYDVSVLNENSHVCNLLAQNPKILVINAPHTDPRYLQDAGADEADVVVSLSDNDSENYMISELAKTEFNCDRTIALVSDPTYEKMFKQLGVDVAISVAGILGNLLQEQLIADAITDMAYLEDGKILVTEVVISSSAPAADKKIRDLDLPQGTIITAIIRGDEVIIPGGDTNVCINDKVLLVSMPAVQGKALRALAGKGEV